MSKVPDFFTSNPERGLALFLGVVILSLGLVFITLAWTEPSGTPPEGRVSAPINVSGSGQAKEGKLGIQTDLSGKGYDSGYALSIGDTGKGSDGLKVSGTTTIDEGILDMGGNKIANVDQIDPVFGIDDTKYVSYMPDSIGQKVLVVSEGKLEGDEKIIDLAEQEKGSDLWLFWQAVARDTVVPFVSAQGPASLYAEMEGSELIVKKINGEDNVEFSLRLIGTRLDHADTDNLYHDQEVENYLDIDKLRE